MAETHRIVIRRPRRHEEEHHGGGWKIAYADFMTAMMAFFLVMWILSLVPKEDLSDIADYFRRPLFSNTKGGDASGSSPSLIPGGNPSVIPNKSGARADQPITTGQEHPEQRERQALEDLREKLETLIATNPRLVEFRPQMVLDMTPEGLRIQIVDGQNRPMFATGSDRMNRDMEIILNELAPTLNGVPNGLSIAGHTDATQYATGDLRYSNWELSSDRANAARKSLVAGGIADNKIQRVMGLASMMNADADPYSHANRRISIVVLNERTQEMMRQTYSTVAEPQNLSARTNAPAVNVRAEPVQIPTAVLEQPPLAPALPSPIPTLEEIEARAQAAAQETQAQAGPES